MSLNLFNHLVHFVTGHCTAEANSTFQDSAASSGTSSEKSSTVTHKTRLGEWDFHGFTISKSSTIATRQGKYVDNKISVTSEPKISIKKSIDAVDNNQDPCISTKKLRTASCSLASFDEEMQPHSDERTFFPSVTPELIKEEVRQPHTLQTSQHRITLAETTNSNPQSKAIQVSHNTTTSSLLSKVQKLIPQPLVCPPNNLSFITKSSTFSSRVPRWLEYQCNRSEPPGPSSKTYSGSLCIKEEPVEKNNVNVKINHLPGKEMNMSLNRSCIYKIRREKLFL